MVYLATSHSQHIIFSIISSGRDNWFSKSVPLAVCQIAGVVWNWNMVITPLLLSVAGLMRLHGVYWPHSAFLELHRKLVIL